MSINLKDCCHLNLYGVDKNPLKGLCYIKSWRANHEIEEEYINIFGNKKTKIKYVPYDSDEIWGKIQNTMDKNKDKFKSFILKDEIFDGYRIIWRGIC